MYRYHIDPYQTEIATRVTGHQQQGVILEDSVCHPQSGGQPGDTGVLIVSDGRQIPIVDTIYADNGVDVLHLLPENTTAPAIGSALTVRIDWARRHRLMRIHSCLHLLNEIIPVYADGCSMDTSGGRLDFRIEPGMNLDRQDIETRLKQLIASGVRLHMRMIPGAELQAQPALLGRMLTPPPPDQAEIHLLEIEGMSVEPCSGTHVRDAREVGPVIVRKIENKGRGLRRVSIMLADAA